MIQGDNPYFVQCEECDAVADECGSPELAEFAAWSLDGFTLLCGDAGCQHFCPGCAEKRKEGR